MIAHTNEPPAPTVPEPEPDRVPQPDEDEVELPPRETDPEKRRLEANSRPASSPRLSKFHSL